MCGIAGLYGFRDDDKIKQFSRELAHRGPDGEGFYLSDSISLLSRRLAIIDRQGGDQPIWNEDKTICVVYNGEMYNYRELKEELEKKGHHFSTKSDTEVFVHGYEEWGEAAFDRYNAMFGVALYDIPRNKLILARDHFGIKPLYYSILDPKKNTVVFSSELKPIVHSGFVQKKVNEKTLFRYLSFRIHDDGSDTFFERIQRLLPGEMMVITPQFIQKRIYSTLEKDLHTATEKTSIAFDKEAIRKFKHLLTSSVQKKLISEVSVGSCLSGGLDSSTITVLVNKLLKEKVSEAESVGEIQNTFSAVFPGSSNDEEQYIDAVCNVTKVQIHKVQPKPEEFFHDLGDFILTQEEPTISTGPYAQYQVMRKAHGKVTVLLDGQGSDEMMAGYLPYYFVYYKQLWKEKKIKKLVRETIQSRDILLKYFIQKMSHFFHHEEKIDIKSILSSQFIEQHTKESFIVNQENLKKRLIDDIFRNSLQSLLRYEDKNSMRFSIEGRVPFLDFDVVRFLFSLPDEAIIAGGWNKNILRKAMQNDLPEMIVQRRNKIGFTTPEHEWFLRMKNKIYSIFLSESFASRPYFNQPVVLRSFQSFIEGKNRDTLLFWRLLNAELWLRAFIDDPKQDEEEKKNDKPYQPNEGKHEIITVKGTQYSRYPLKTKVIAKGDDVAEIITKEVNTFIKNKDILNGKKWFVIVSEKIVAIAQGRSYFLWEINPTFMAKLLSSYVKRTPYGIGLGSPWTMQLAINEVGLPRILLASVASIAGKLVSKSGIFYHIVGREVASIDGPTEYSLYPSNVSAKLGPKDPNHASKIIAESIRKSIGSLPISHFFEGAAIIDANDIGRTILGNATSLFRELIESILSDNPMGQANEQTPVIVVSYDT